MDINQKIELIKRNTQEIVGEDELRQILKKRDLVVYLGTSITGRPHVGYYFWVRKVADFLEAGCKVKILLADIHGMLDDLKTPYDMLKIRTEYYKECISGMLESLNVDTKKLEFVVGSDYQLDKKYMLDVLKLASLSTFHDCNKAASEVVRFGESPKLGGYIYPIMQALDEEYLKVDAQFGGVDQRKIMMFAREKLPLLGYKPRAEIMTPMLPSLVGGKMSSSEAKGKIDLLDHEREVEFKINSAYCVTGEIEDNGLLIFLKNVIMVEDKKIDIQRPDKFGGNKTYNKYSEIEKDFKDGKLHPMDFKKLVANEINGLLSIVRKRFKGKENLIKQAYP
ncbi:tyrosine--tRNA ligase [Candidatus Woesearchaeota archaeon]|nr:tyrosine--tRNA ligase [Candidatus Woesearchaeota archaeon]